MQLLYSQQPHLPKKSERRLAFACCQAMVRFKKTSAAAPVASSPSAAPARMDLGTLMTVKPMPLSAVSTMGRVTYIFGFTEGSSERQLEGWGCICWVFVGRRGWPGAWGFLVGFDVATELRPISGAENDHLREEQRRWRRPAAGLSEVSEPPIPCPGD